MKQLIFFPSVFLFFTSCQMTGLSQPPEDITRIEFNSGTRTYHEQIILTKDSISIVEEDFRVDLEPRSKKRAMSDSEWSSLMKSLKELRLSEIETLQSPSMKRTYDGAAHGSLLITTHNGNTYSHGFDDEDPHRRFRPLMEQIKRIRKK